MNQIENKKIGLGIDIDKLRELRKHVEKFECWHPLYKYFKRVCDIYDSAVFESLPYCIPNWDKLEPSEKMRLLPNLIFCNDFKKYLDFLQYIYDGAFDTSYKGSEELKELFKVFEPLHIATFGNFVLFKYEGYIDLANKGYKDNSFFDLYNGLYRECRSVVFDVKNLQIVLAPQRKFFNINENPENELNKIMEKISTCKKVEFSDKLDGSNENFRWYELENRLIGSSASVLDRNESWRLDGGYEFIAQNEGYLNMMKAYSDWTFMYEFITPKNQIIVYYPPEKAGLYLFGMRNVYTGEEKMYEEVIKIGKEFGVPTTEIFDTDINTLLNSLDNYRCKDKEGWVIRILQNDGEVFKTKLKINEYILMHRAISKIVSPNSIIQAIYEDKFDDFFSKIPIGFRDSVTVTKNTIISYTQKMHEIINTFITKAKKAKVYDINNMKAFIDWCNQNVPQQFINYCIADIRGHEYNFLRTKSGRMLKLHEIEDSLQTLDRYSFK